MDIKDLRYFVAVYESLGFARASLLLNTVQSNVSARVKRLELTLGVTLFERHRRGIRATQEGELLYRYAKRVIALLAETEKAVKIKEVDRKAA
jgi:LysR family transcriptional regulator, cell division regulator